jgi:exonuclease SbcC
MNIKTIRFRNINSLRNEHVIDFTDEPLKEAGLFAITGNTGSGKSTILDVISLALYNRIPRFDVKQISKGFIEKTGSILTKNTKEAYAEVIYECHEGEFRSKWSISTARTGNLRDHEMELADNKTNKLLDLKKSDVSKHNESLIGLSYEQFIRSILLAQGDFAKFLQSDKDERGELLEKITGSWIYREIGKKAFEWSKFYGQELEKIQERAHQIKGSLINEEEFKQIKAQLKAKEKEIENLEQRKNHIEEALKHKNEIEKAWKQLQEATEKEKSESEKLKHFNENQGISLSKHKQLIPWEELLRNWKQKDTEFQKHQEKEEQLRSNLEKAKKKVSNTHKSVEKLLTKKLQKEELIPELEAFEKKILKIQKEQEDLRKEYKFNHEKAHDIISNKDIPIELKNIPLAKEQLNNQKTQAEEQIRQLNQKLEQTELESPSNSLENTRQYIELTKKWQTATDWVNYYNKEKEKTDKELTNQQKDLETIPGKLKQAEELEQRLQLQLENLRKTQQINQLTAKLEKQRQNLEPNQPCPLCGSKEHPYVEEYAPSTDDLSEKIDEKKQEHSKALSHLKELQAEKKRLEKSIKEAREKSRDYEEQNKHKKNEISSIQEKLPEQYRNYDPNALAEKLNKKKEQFEDYINLQEKLHSFEKLQPIIDQLENTVQKGKQKTQELSSLYKGNDVQKDVDALKKQINDAGYNLETAKKDLINWEDEQSRLNKELKGYVEQLLPMLNEFQYPEIKQALNDLLSPWDYEALQKKQNEIESAIASAKSAKEAHEQHYKTLKEKDTEESYETLEVKLTNLYSELKQQKEKRDDLFSKVNFQNKQKQTLKELEEKIAEQKEKNEKWVLLNQYIGDSQGKNFSTFAQQLTLEQLVKLANKRIASLSKRYILDKPKEDEAESLVIKDMDMGGQRRSVKTLSGGESFLISLSLALALSDLASRNVDIKSLFIDEGFGSLDQLTLDQTLDTLEKLQAESEKTIGIISNIEALKERMDTRIEVIRDGQGFSNIEIKRSKGII